MDLTKCVIEGKYKSFFYSKKGETINEKNSALLGFKDLLPVLSNSMVESGSSLDLGVKKTLKVEVNSQTGEKFINLNGRKLKMVAESELPPQLRQNTHLMKVASANGLVARKPVTIKILGNVSSLLRSVNLMNKQESREIDKNNFKPNVNKADSSIGDDLSQKTKLIKENKLHTVKNTSVGKVLAAKASTVICVNGMKQNAKYTKAKLVTNFKDSEAKGFSSVDTRSDMETSDLPKLCKISNPVSDQTIIKTDKSVQIDRDNFQNDKCVQTEETFPPLIESQDLFNLRGDFDLFDFLTDEGPSTTIPTKTMNTNGLPFFPVTPSKNIDTVEDKRLRIFFKDLNSALKPDAKGNMPIHVGVLTNDVEFVKRCCNILKALQKSVDLLNHSNLTALQLAVFNDSNPEIVKTLLRHNASLDVIDLEGNNILHLAVEFERKNILDIVLRAADERGFSLDHFNAEGMTPLMICCCNRLYECADLLLKYSADVNVRDRKSGRTALFHAAENHDYDMVQLLLNNKADTKIKNFFGTSPHDAMYEVEEIPEQIKMVILGRSTKRKIIEEPGVVVKVKKTEPKRELKTYARFKKISDFDFGTNISAGQVK